MATETKTGERFMASAHSASEAGYRQRIRMGRHTLLSDEPEALGGHDEGPAPYAILLASLASCTAITLTMYAERKSWPLGEVKVDLALYQDGDADRIDRTLHLSSTLTDEQREKLLAIAEKTPVTRTLKRSATIVTKLA